MEKYLIVSGREIIKTYKSFKQAMKDLDFFKLIYKDVYICKRVVDENGNIIR